MSRDVSMSGRRFGEDVSLGGLLQHHLCLQLSKCVSTCDSDVHGNQSRDSI